MELDLSKMLLSGMTFRDRYIRHLEKTMQKVYKYDPKVTVDKDKHTITISGINYNRLMKHLGRLYAGQRIYKIFEVLYNLKDWEKFQEGKMHKQYMRITGIQTPEFFALELSILFDELYHEYKLPEYRRLSNYIKTLTWLSDANKATAKKLSIEPALNNLKYTPTKYQKTFIESYPILKASLSLNGYYLSFDQGLGKTYTSVALAECLGHEKVIIVCPKTLMTTSWTSEFSNMLKEPYSVEKDVYFHGITKTYKNQKYIVVNYEKISDIVDIFSTNRPSSTMLIVDEAHNFRDMNTARLEALLSLHKVVNPIDTLVMSGTPIKASPSEICPALMLIDRKFTLEAAKIYSRCFKLDKWLATDIIQARFSKVIYRKLKSDLRAEGVLTLPDKYVDNMPLTVSGDMEMYQLDRVKKDVRAYFEKLLKETASTVADNEKRFKQLVHKLAINTTYDEIEEFLEIIVNSYPNFALDQPQINLKQNFLDEHVYSNTDADKADIEELEMLIKVYVRRFQSCMGKAIGAILVPRRRELFMRLFLENKELFKDMIYEAEKKTVIFTTYVAVAETIAKTLNADGVRTLLITGATKDRNAIVEQFKNDTNVEVLVATAQTLGVGVTLTEANNMLFFGVPWRGADFNQCSDRIYRIGQTTDCYIWKVVLDTVKMNLSTRMEDILEWSNMMTDTYMVTDNQTGVVNIEESVKVILTNSLNSEFRTLVESIDYEEITITE